MQQQLRSLLLLSLFDSRDTTEETRNCCAALIEMLQPIHICEINTF